MVYIIVMSHLYCFIFHIDSAEDSEDQDGTDANPQGFSQSGAVQR